MMPSLCTKMIAVAVVLLVLSAACQTDSVSGVPTPATLTAVAHDSLKGFPSPTAPASTPRTAPLSPSPSRALLAPSEVPPPTLPPPTTTDTSTPPASAIPFEGNFRVVYVTAADQLNVREGPGIGNEIVTALDPGTTDVGITADGQIVDGSLWVPIVQGGRKGWVNSRFLTEQWPQEAFCSSDNVNNLLQQFGTAVEQHDSRKLASLFHPERGLRIRVSWWNPEIHLTGQELEQLFESRSNHAWGIADGSGLPINGTFGEVILPLLLDDLVQASDFACLEILHGPTAGLVKLPDEYAGVNYVSYFRAAQHETGFDWGAWVVGIEQWQSRPYVSFLVHFGYEI